METSWRARVATPTMAKSKSELRHLALDRRKQIPNKDELSRKITERLKSLDSYKSAQKVLIYISVRSEVRTWPLIEQRLQAHLPVFIPYCSGDILKIFRLTSGDQLARGSFGILEPSRELRTDKGLHASIGEIDLIVVPGVAFDTRGRRLGYGKGYFDRLLSDSGAGLAKIGLAYECQVFNELPVADHDVSMDSIVTEQAQTNPDVPGR